MKDKTMDELVQEAKDRASTEFSSARMDACRNSDGVRRLK